MSERNPVKIWAAQVRGPFLLLAVVLVFIGGAMASNDGAFSWGRFFLCLVAAVLAHASVNLFNELSDFRTGIDENTRRTPFSGGSGNLQTGKTAEYQVQAAAWGTLAVAGVIGLYLSYLSGPFLLVLILVGGLTSVFYTSRLARLALGELMAGVCLGSLVVVGTYYSMAEAVTAQVVWTSVPPGILTALLLFLNEFPDLEADRAGGRRHLVILLGRRASARLYAAAMAACYLFIAAGVLVGLLPAWTFLSYLTLPLAIKASRTTLEKHDSFESMVPALGANVGTVLGTDFLLAVAFLLA